MSKFNSFNKNIGRLGVLTAITLSLLRCNSPANTQKNNDEQTKSPFSDEQTKGSPSSKPKAPANNQSRNQAPVNNQSRNQAPVNN